jgi:hypothetical protein
MSHSYSHIVVHAKLCCLCPRELDAHAISRFVDERYCQGSGYSSAVTRTQGRVTLTLRVQRLSDQRCVARRIGI